jgi:hypothetical protein
MENFRGTNKFSMEDWIRADQFFMAVDMLIRKNGARPFLFPTANLQQMRDTLQQQRLTLGQKIAIHDELGNQRINIHNRLKEAIRNNQEEEVTDLIQDELYAINEDISYTGVTSVEYTRHKGYGDEIKELDRTIEKETQYVAKVIDGISESISDDLSQRFNRWITGNKDKNLTFGQKSQIGH